MGFNSRQPTSNDFPKKSEHPWAKESDSMDIFSLALNGMIKKCQKCNRWARLNYLTEGVCPDCIE